MFIFFATAGTMISSKSTVLLENISGGGGSGANASSNRFSSARMFCHIMKACTLSSFTTPAFEVSAPLLP